MAVSLSALRIELLGKLRVCVGTRQTTRFETRRTALLLARLALPPLRSWPREELIELLWPDEDPATTRTRFRQTLASLRRALGELGISEESILQASRASVGLDSAQVVSDVTELESCLRQASTHPERGREALDRALELYEHHLMPGFYETWVLSERDRLAHALRESLLRLALALTSTEPEAAISYGRRAVSLDPLSEVAQEQLLRILVQAGRPTEAARHWKEIERLFWKELRTLPPESLKAALQPRPQSLALESTPLSSPAPPRRTGLPRSLPTALDRFFGRESERATLAQLLAKPGTVRLVTLTGPPGVGKTRLALEVGHQLEQESPEKNVLFVALETVPTSEVALAAIYEAAGGQGESGALLPGLIQLLGTHPHPLLILDNAEGVSGLAEPLHRLLQGVPELRCLVTSQRAFQLPGEHERVLEPLALESDAAAFQLLLDRAQRARPNLELTPQSRDEILGLCRDLEGLPLALELAAAWLGVLSPEQVRSRLSRDHRLLTRRSGETAVRHSSLHAALQQSVERLSATQQEILARLAVFRGGWSLEAAEQICEDLSPVALLDLEALQAASLITAFTQPDGSLRFKMLESVRLFAATSQTPEGLAQAQRSHLDYFCSYAQALLPLFESPEQFRYFEGLAQEQENLQAALALARQSAPAVGAQLAVAFWRYWDRRGRHSSGQEVMEALLTDLPETERRLRAQLEESLGRLLLSQLRYPRAAAYLGQSKRDYAALGESVSAAFVQCYELAALRETDPYSDLTPLLAQCREAQAVIEREGTLAQKGLVSTLTGGFYFRMRQAAPAREHLERALTLCRVVGNQRSVFSCLHLLGCVERSQGSFDASLALELEAIDQAKSIGDDFAVVIVLWNLYDMFLEAGRLEEAETYAREGLTLTQQHGMAGSQALFLSGLGRICAQRNELTTAREWFRQGIRQGEPMGEVAQILLCTRGLVRLALEEARVEPTPPRQRLAAHLWGTLLRLEELLQPRQQYDFSEPLDPALEQLQRTLGVESFEAEKRRAQDYHLHAALQVPLLYPEEVEA